MDKLEYYHAVEAYIGRELDRTDDGEMQYIDDMCDEGQSVQLTAEACMTREDFKRIYG